MRARTVRFFAALGATVLAAAGLLAVSAPASAENNDPGVSLFAPTTFYVYAETGESLDLAFPRIGSSGVVADVTVNRPDGTDALVCASGPSGDACDAAGRIAVDQTGVWTVDYVVPSNLSGRRHAWTITVFDAPVAGAAVPGRVWVERYDIYQGSGTDQTYWFVTREGYRYAAAFGAFNGIGSRLQANGFGLVHEGTCTPIYRSAEGTSTSANGVPLEDGVAYSGPECGDAYKIFFDAPADDLPASATSPRGTEWILNSVAPVTVDDLQFVQDAAASRAGNITFEIGGVNGGYSVQIDTNGDGDFDDPTDRVIPWGSPPGAVSVPFDGLDGAGEPIGVCQAMNARVAVDRVGEVHFTLEDVEQLTGGVTLTGATPDIVAAPPLLYWDDRALATAGRGSVTPVLDGRAGSAAAGAHGWSSGGTSWGDIRAIENWSYYAASAGETVAVAAPCAPGLQLQKDGVLVGDDGDGLADLGETITYTFTATNTGNTPLTDVAVIDSRVTTGITPASQDIPVGGEVVFTADYVVTQEDLDAGTVLNTATALGLDPTGESVGSNEARDVVPTPDRAPALTLEKSGGLLNDVDEDGLADLGDTIAYEFEITNTGNVTVTDIAIDDPRLAGFTPATVTLAPGATQVVTADPYVVTQDDVNRGEVYNVATATGTSPLGPVGSPPSEERIDTPEPDPGLAITKTGELTTDVDGNGFADVGDTMTYTFEVSNIGTVDLADVTVADARVPVITPAAQDLTAGGSDGDTGIFTGTLVVTQADVDAGVVHNSATAEGTYEGPDGDVPVESPPAIFDFETIEPAPALVVTKSGVLNDLNGNSVADVGETVVYSFEVENTGNTTLVNVRVEDPRIDGIAPSADPLLPGGSVEFVSDPYVVTQADIDAGVVANTATARGNVPGGPETTSPPDSFDLDTVEPDPALTIDKSAELQDGDGDGRADAGETIVYRFLVENTGNVTLRDVAVVDDRVEELLPASIDVLMPGATVTFLSSPYLVTEEDVAAGDILNVASAEGTPPTGDRVASEPDEVTTPVNAPPGGGSGGGELGATGATVAWGALIAALAAAGAGAFLLIRSRRRARRA